VKQFDCVSSISRFEKPLPPFSRGKLNLSIADLGWCLLNLVKRTLVLMFMFCKLVLDHFIHTERIGQQWNSICILTAVIKLLPFNFDFKRDLILK
jgi:hypothetical protein